MELLLTEILNKIAGRISHSDRRYNQGGLHMDGIRAPCASTSAGG